MSDDCDPHGIERPSYLLIALDELEASKCRHPASGKQDDELPDNVIPLFPRNKPNN